MSVIFCNSLINKLCSVSFISQHFTVSKSVCSVRNVQPCLEWRWQGFKQKAHPSNDILVNISNWKFRGSPMCAGIPLPPMLSHELGVTSLAKGLNQLIESNAQHNWCEPVLPCSRITSHRLSCNKEGLKIKGRRKKAKSLSGVNWLTCLDFVMNWNLNCRLLPSVDNLIRFNLTLIYKLTCA